MDNLFSNKNDFDDLGKLKPEDYLSKGIELAKLGKFQESLLIFDVYLELFPWDTIAINNKADVYIRMNELDKAKSQILYALTLNPRLAVGWCTLAEILSVVKQRFCSRLAIETADKLSDMKNDMEYRIIKQQVKNMNEGKDIKPIFL